MVYHSCRSIESDDNGDDKEADCNDLDGFTPREANCNNAARELPSSSVEGVAGKRILISRKG